MGEKMKCGHEESVYRNWADDAPHYCIVCGLGLVQAELKAKELHLDELKGALGRANENVSLLLGKLRDQLDMIVKDWGEAFAKHGFPLHRGLTPEQNAAEWRQESDRLLGEERERCAKIAEEIGICGPDFYEHQDDCHSRIAKEIRKPIEKRNDAIKTADNPGTVGTLVRCCCGSCGTTR